MSGSDIRWIQRYNSYLKALSQLMQFVVKGELSDLEKLGLIHTFEYTYELAWNTLKDYFEMQGETNINGSRDAFRLAFKRELIEDGETWMAMITSRTLTSHTYNQEIADKTADDIASRYYPAFVALHTRLSILKDEAG